MRETSRVKSRIEVCKVCGTMYHPYPNNNGLFCSRECYYIYKREHQPIDRRTKNQKAIDNMLNEARDNHLSYGKYIATKVQSIRPNNPKEYFGF